uniref:CSON014577 protein n=1 Tax=Culicoides sonorensis TaxID=179676 RepID=A0A336KQM8_CULSO
MSIEAATKIQAAFRGHKTRAKMKQGDANNEKENGAEREPTKEELEAEFDLNDKELTHAATKIQACFRGHVERKKIHKDEDGEKKDEVEDIDIDEITKKVAEELDIDLDDPELNKAATKIQATFRGHKTRATHVPATDGN